MNLLFLYRLALRCIGLAVPRPLRAEWAAEWESELWYFAEAVPEHGEIAAFCWGAVEDAQYLRAAHAATSPARAAGSARSCVAWVGGIAVVCFGLAQALPGVRLVMSSPVYRVAGDSVMIVPAESKAGTTMALGRVRAWQRKRQHLFSEFAFYAPVVRSLRVDGTDTRPLTIARASNNVLTMLGVPVAHAVETDESAPALVLSQTAWRESFGEDLGIFGKTVRVGTLWARVAGVVPDEAAPTRARLDGWLLLPPAAAAALPDTTGVFLLARQARETGSGLPRWTMTVAGPEGEADYECMVLPPLRADVWRLYLFAVFLALLALPATTSLSLGESAARPRNLPWTSALRRWGFLLMKIVCAMPAVYFGGLVMAYGVRWQNVYTPQYIQLVSTFCLTLFALRWALRDQRRRCPVCLGMLTCPARVGEPSRNFLAWNGTELICAGGHGLMHVPEMPTSWFRTQRWLHLDPSWSGLFLGPVKAFDA